MDTKTRTVAYAQEGITDPDDNAQHMVAIVTEGEPGYAPTNWTGPLDYCKQVAANINTDAGYSSATVHTVVASSMAAQNRGE